MNHVDYALLALALWREARGEGYAGQVAVACVVRNRVLKRSTSYYAEVTKPWAFSSITAPRDPQLGVYPNVLDNIWQQCQQIAQSVADGDVSDTTGGATLYFNPNGLAPNDKSPIPFRLSTGAMVAFPKPWNPAVVSETVQIGAHVFLREH